MQVLASQLLFLANRNAEHIILASQLHINRGACCTAEWPHCLFPVLCINPTKHLDFIQRCLIIDISNLDAFRLVLLRRNNGTIKSLFVYTDNRNYGSV